MPHDTTSSRAPDGSSQGSDRRPAADGEPDTDEPELDEAERQSPDAPALGAMDDGTRLSDPPEPQEPG